MDKKSPQRVPALYCPHFPNTFQGNVLAGKYSSSQTDDVKYNAAEKYRSIRGNYLRFWGFVEAPGSLLVVWGEKKQTNLITTASSRLSVVVDGPAPSLRPKALPPVW